MAPLAFGRWEPWESFDAQALMHSIPSFQEPSSVLTAPWKPETSCNIVSHHNRPCLPEWERIRTLLFPNSMVSTLPSSKLTVNCDCDSRTSMTLPLHLSNPKRGGLGFRKLNTSIVRTFLNQMITHHDLSLGKNTSTFLPTASLPSFCNARLSSEISLSFTTEDSWTSLCDSSAGCFLLFERCPRRVLPLPCFEEDDAFPAATSMSSALL